MGSFWSTSVGLEFASSKTSQGGGASAINNFEEVQPTNGRRETPDRQLSGSPQKISEFLGSGIKLNGRLS